LLVRNNPLLECQDKGKLYRGREVAQEIISHNDKINNTIIIRILSNYNDIKVIKHDHIIKAFNSITKCSNNNHQCNMYFKIHNILNTISNSTTNKSFIKDSYNKDNKDHQ